MLPIKLYDPVYASVLAVGLLAFNIGASLTWSSPVGPKLRNDTTTPFDQPITMTEVSWMSSLMTLGGAVGSLIFVHLVNAIGRRKTLLSLGVPLFIAYVLMATVQKAEVYYAARILIGLAAGGIFTVGPLYCGEISSKANRGILNSIMSCGTNLGVLFSYAVGPWMGVVAFNCLLGVFPLIFLACFFFVGEETAHFYLVNNKEELGRHALKKHRSASDNVEEELQQIKRKKEETQGKVLSTLKSGPFIKAMIISVGLLIAQQMSGINAFLMYSQNIFFMAGSNLDPAICSIIVGLVQFGSNVTFTFFVDRFGRKTILRFAALSLALCEIPLGVYCYLSDEGVDVNAVRFLPILLFTLFILAYNHGFGPLPWILLSEVFPTNVKTIAFSIATCINWTLAFLITKYFSTFVESIGLGPTFWLFGASCIAALIFIHIFVLETKGKTLEEIQDDLEKLVYCQASEM
ncbi:unnamed protein product [Phaedon cochleariae]|uniref:Major facilitator superfamily (MFS) profile domain-containing protein n=1 Tax=Phaedon cochleariae TaxID=80249 RepID=A0A9P0DRH3_PHACE|nr:unnamed protein product [Phaedon cochleariae]